MRIARIFYLNRGRYTCHLPLSLTYASWKATFGNCSVWIADSGMTILVKKNAGLFSHKAAIQPKTKPAFHRGVARWSDRLLSIRVWIASLVSGRGNWWLVS